jgi:hypothetical protein
MSKDWLQNLEDTLGNNFNNTHQNTMTPSTTSTDTKINPISKRHKATKLGDITRPNKDDGNELISKRWLCRGRSVLFVAPTGAGKSVFAMQAGVSWSINKPCMGLRSVKPFRVLYVQAENDEGDLVEIRDGIFKGLALSPEEIKQASENFLVSTIDDATGKTFLDSLKSLLDEHKPDLLIVDPLLAYTDTDISSQLTVSAFLRGGLQQLITAANCGLLLVHHPVKPKKDNGNSKVGEDAYYGAGSADLANWARAIMTLRPTTSQGIYKLKLTKRGQRAGWVEDDGKTLTFERTVAQGKGGLIYWREPETDEVANADTTNNDKIKLLALVPSEKPLDKNALISMAQTNGIGVNRVRGFIDELVAEGKLFPWKTRRSGTNPKVSLARQPQSPPSDFSKN